MATAITCGRRPPAVATSWESPCPCCKIRTDGGARATTCFSSTVSCVRPSTERALKIISSALLISEEARFPTGFSARPLKAKSAQEAALPFLARGKLLMYAEFMLDEKDFQRKADATFEDLKRRMLTARDEHGFDVEGEAGKLEVLFEEPEEAKFVISPNTPVREIWVSALSTSFKLGWNESRNAFVHEKTGEDLRAVMSRVISQQLGAQVTL